VLASACAPTSCRARSDGYARRRPEQTLLYRLVSEHWPRFRERAELAGDLPGFVVRTVEGYLECGRLEHGFARLACRACGHELHVAFSCKRRGLCPSCAGRRMSDLAAHLVDAVFPDVPVRQWVCSLPWRLRYPMGYDPRLCTDVLRVFVGALKRSLRWRAKRQLGLRSVDDAHVGAVTFVQRSDSALRLNVHFHTLALDGVYVRSEAGALDFHRLGEPTRADVERVAAWTHAGLLRVLARHGRSLEGIEHAPDAMRADEPVLASCYGASAADVQLLGDAPGSRTDKLVRPLRALCAPGPRGPLAEVGGVNIHAKVCVEGPEALERLCRYTARPLLAQDRLDLHGDGRVRYRFKTTWRDGTCAILLDPLDFIARLCALIGRPGRHAVRYHGVLAGNATLRAQVVPGRAPVHGEQLALLPPADGGPPAPRPPARRPWAQLLRRVFAVDVLACPTCGGRMRLLEVVTKGHLARRVARAPPRRGQLDLDLDAARHHAT